MEILLSDNKMKLIWIIHNKTIGKCNSNGSTFKGNQWSNYKVAGLAQKYAFNTVPQ